MPSPIFSTLALSRFCQSCPLDSELIATQKHLTNLCSCNHQVSQKNHGSGLVIVVFVLFQSCSDAGSFSQQWPLNIQTQKTCSLCISGVFQGGCQVPKEPVSPTRLSPNVCPPWKARRQGPPTPTSLPQRGLPPPFHLSFNISTLPEECQSN